MSITRLVFGVALVCARLSFAQCPTTGDCLTPHAGIGCADAACCNTVCAIDTTCCEVQWDTDCAMFANTTCSICGASGLGSCFVTHALPRCDDAACCATVCQFDAYCCSTTWDLTCAVYAGAFCEPGGTVDCGDPNSGSCTIAHGTPGCDVATCCEAVCAKDATCCSQAWDALCVAIANQVCTTQCEPPCPGGSTIEAESCATAANDVCVAPVAGNQAQPLLGGKACGALAHDPFSGVDRVDVDVWSVTVPDTDGDGVARVLLGFQCSADTWAALVPAGSCGIAASPLHVQLIACTEGVAQACIPAGDWRVVCTSGAFPAQAPPLAYPCPGRPYALRIEVDDFCDLPCESDRSCISPHATPGCSDAACCAATCAMDAFCCDVEWDASCVESAVDACTIAPPSNDECSGAFALVPGVPALVQTGPATVGTLLAPAGCLDNALPAGHDVWCTVGPLDASGLVKVSTCSANTEFDTALALYRGDCSAVEAEACSATGLCQPQSHAELEFELACGEVAYLRVFGAMGELGQAQVLLTAAGGTACPGACPADLNGDGQVDGADLGSLLSAWGVDLSADLNGDGLIDGADLGVMLSAWGPCV